ncbi:MAG: hypothetical protein HS108_05210 [Planctomycetes bacterium]|jgi:hypothetical protein|nr:hypothetical protein [Planctomycetota bacterium]MCL4730849.1 hypothetical protein [Planctomycetota bacterium]
MRTVLYANAEISQYLRDNFVLQWTSERPVPKITIDFGDGRKLERTITGNSVHYVLDADGNPLDALPGLYAPLHFRIALDKARLLHAELQDKPAPERDRLMQLYHRSRAAALEERLAAALGRAGGNLSRGDTEMSARVSEAEAAFLARVDGFHASAAIRRGVTKSLQEMLWYVALSYDRADIEGTAIETWRKVAAGELPDPGLDSRSLVLMGREVSGLGRLNADAAAGVRRAANPFAAEKAVSRAMGKSIMVERPLVKALTEAEDKLARMAANFEESLAIDTVRNEYQFHSQIHHWFARREVQDLATLNERVYREVFLTPRSDPWLGLAPADAFSGVRPQ